MLAGIELGGTKCIAVLADGPKILAREQLPTDRPQTTLPALRQRLNTWRQNGANFSRLGIASFGPLSLDRQAADYGQICTTPKPGWSGCDLIGAFAGLGVPIALETDVNGAALAEGLWGAARGTRVHVYLTIGTGIGGGLIIDGRIAHGRLHPEMGHVRVRRTCDDGFAGICAFHGDCLEGLASGPAIAARSGRTAGQIAPDDPLWEIIGGEIGELVTTLILMIAPDRILIGGGVGRRAELLHHVQQAALTQLAGYRAGYDKHTILDTVCHPGLGEDAGPLGAIAVALAG